jgi:hypothetical protein
MDWARRPLSAVLCLALAQFGAMATAPAHAHEIDASHGVHAVAVLHIEHGHVHAAPRQDVGAHDDGHNDDGQSSGSMPADDSNGQERSDGDAITHVHSCPSFVPAAMPDEFIPVAIAEAPWPSLSAGAATHASAPPLRPPRTSL